MEWKNQSIALSTFPGILSFLYFVEPLFGKPRAVQMEFLIAYYTRNVNFPKQCKVTLTAVFVITDVTHPGFIRIIRVREKV